jgi:hypothetical protein
MDDLSLRPKTPKFKNVEPEYEELASVTDKKTARAFFHPSWEEVEKMFLESIEQCRLPVQSSLPAEEYKIEGRSNEKVANKLTEILERVKNAVSAVEQSKRGEE